MKDFHMNEFLNAKDQRETYNINKYHEKFFEK
jgi:hypothetical protein